MSDDNTPMPAPGLEPVPSPTQAPATPTPTASRHPRRSGIWWGVALVLVGIALLVSQFAPGIRLWRFWPLIIIAFGVRAMFGSSGTPWSIKALTEGLFTVALGLIFLGQMLGYLAWDVWLNILSLWPLLLIAVGLEIVGKGLRSEWVRALGNLVVIGGLAYGALVMTGTGGWPIALMPAGDTEPFSLSAADDAGVREGFASVDGGVGSLTVAAGDGLVTADGRSPFEPVFEVDLDGRVADVAVGLGEHTWGPLESDTELDVTLSGDVAWDLDVSAGVTEYDLDLSGLLLRSLILDSGVSDGTVTLGEADEGDAQGAIPVVIEAGVSALRVRVPEGDSVRVTIQPGLTGVDMRGEWERIENEGTPVYESERFDDDAFWDIEIQAGIGGITVEYY
jgi:hypothetical protein